MKTRSKLLLCFMLIFALSLSLFGISAAAYGTYTLSTGENCSGVIVHEFGDTVIDSGLSRAIGSFCDGLQYDSHNRYITISGSPAKAGTYWVNGVATLANGSTENYDFIIVVEGSDPYLPVTTPGVIELPNITKDPTEESMLEGGSAMFIARADNAETIEWFLLDKNGEYYAPGYAASLYTGFNFAGRNGEVFEIYNVPLEMDGWSAVCIFSNDGGSVESDPAGISVTEFSGEVPSITSHPQSASKAEGESVILSVLANNNSEGSTLKYQWYMSSTGSGNLNPISGANASSYTPPQTSGTVYYTVAVWSSYEDRDGAKAYSNPAAVTYASSKPSPTPRPSPTASPVPSARPSTAPSPDTSFSPVEEEKGGSLLLPLVIALILSAALAAVIMFILRKNAKQQAFENAKVSPIRPIKTPAAKAETAAPAAPAENTARLKPIWQCTCGALNDSQFCTQCGKPKGAKPSCKNCGWTPDSPNQIPRFCPECGSPFEEN